MIKEVLPLKYGVVFKKAFGKVEVFKAFVKDVLGIELEIDEVQQEYEYPQTLGEVRTKYDLFAEDSKNRTIVEIQHIKEDDFYDRFLYYEILGIAEQIIKSADYSISKTVYSIIVLTSLPRDKSIYFSTGIVDFDVLIQDQDKFGQKAGIYEHKLVFLNPKLVSAQTPALIRPWLELIEDSLDSRLDSDVYTAPIFQKIITEIRLDRLSIDERTRLKDEAVWDKTKRNAFEEGVVQGEAKGRAEGKAEGRAEGKAEGEAEGRAKVAQNMLRLGIALNQIAQATGLSIEEIQKLSL